MKKGQKILSIIIALSFVVSFSNFCLSGNDLNALFGWFTACVYSGIFLFAIIVG